MEAGCDVMTDNQYYGIIKMMFSIVKNAGSHEKALAEIESLLRDSDRAEMRAAENPKQ
ncbi:MAG: hypothetical protein FWG71_05455 [Synergistaceae bacterium]|nr:hypothetical protein [Synergistaceae bacterium]